MADIIQIRRGTSASATSNNPTLANGEFGFETDTKKLKIGDGVTAWNSLPYVSVTADVATAIITASSKTTPVDADQFGITDSGASNVLKRLTWANIKATLKTYFDTLYELKFSKGNIIQGTNVTITGTLTNRLVGSGDVTINASGGGGASPTEQVVTASSRVDNLVLNASAEIVKFNGTGIELTGMVAGGVVRRITVLNVTGDFFYISTGFSATENQFIQSFAMGHNTTSEWIYSPTVQRWFKIGN